MPCLWSLYLCVEFFLWRRSCVSSPPAGGGVGSYCASFGVTAQQSSWGTCGFLLCVMQLATLLGFHTSLIPVGWPPPAVEVSRGVGGVLLQRSCSPTLVFYLVPAQLPLPLLLLRGSAPLPGASACLTPVCWSTPGVVLEGSLLCHLVFSHVPCSSSGPAACAAFLDAGSLGVFRSPGVCPSASLVPWVGFQPFPYFSMFLLLRLLARVAGVMRPVSGCSRYGDVCLVCR